MPSFALLLSRGVNSITSMVCVYTYETWTYTSNLSVVLSVPVYSCAMGQAEELYFAMVDVGYTAIRCKIPGPLSQTMIDTARDWLETWREDERTLISFASMLLSDPSGILTPQHLCAVRGQLPEPFVDACWRLLRLLEYLRIDPDDG